MNTAAESSGRGRKTTFKGIIPIEKLKFNTFSIVITVWKMKFIQTNFTINEYFK